MTWTARQRSILRELGLGAVLPPQRAAAAAPVAAASVATAVDPAPATVVDEPPNGEAAAARLVPAPPPLPARGSTPSRAAAPATAAAPAPAGRAVPAAGAATERPDASRIALLDWDELRAQVQSCQACPLAQSRRQTVFGVGLHEARWMIVGEAPGESEDKLGEPFVGAAGKLLDRMLGALGLTRDVADGAGAPTPPERAVYIANTLKCRPPGNRNPTPHELQTCEPFLARQIALVQPQVILAMGRFAVGRLLRSEAPIGKLRGQVHRVGTTPVVVTYHPAYLLRNPIDKARAWEDLCLAADIAQAGVMSEAGSTPSAP